MNWNDMNLWMQSRYAGTFTLLALWSIVWKGFALWRSAKEGSRYWFVSLLLLNTAGLLEIAYLFFFANERLTLSAAPKSKPKSRKKK